MKDSVKSALKEFYRLSLIEAKRKLTPIENSTKNGIRYTLASEKISINDLSSEEKNEIERKVKNESVRRV